MTRMLLSSAFGFLMVGAAAFRADGPAVVVAVVAVAAVVASAWWRPAATVAVLLAVATVVLADSAPMHTLLAGLAAAGEQGGPLKDGMELTYRQLLKVAADNGLVVVDPAGQPFNPEHHQAISQADPGDAAPGSVLQVFQKGYLLNDRLLRPALVVVARHD